MTKRARKAIGQGQDVFAAFAQRRQVQGDDVEAIEQVFAEAAVAHHVFKVEVGGRQNAHIGPAGDRVADTLVFLVLNETQQLWLQGQRKVADLIEKQRAAVGLIDSAQACFRWRR